MAGRVVINSSALADLLRGPDGPVIRRFIIVGDRVKEHVVSQLKEGFVKDFLGPTIVKRVEMASNGPHIRVGSDKIQTQAHQIVGNPVLAFNWPQAGGMVFFTSVNHPGSNFEKYLRTKLVASLDVVRGAL